MTAHNINQDIQQGGEARTRTTPSAQAHGRPDGGEGQQGMLQGVSAEQLARGLGWFGIGLGIAQLVAPRRLAQLVGASDGEETCAVMRTVGLREIVTGIGILSGRSPAGWLLARAGGDIMDLALLGSAAKSDHSNHPRVTATAAAVVGVMALDLYCGEQLRHGFEGQQRALPRDRSIRVQESITVNRPPAELYAFWHRFENLPRFMAHLDAVQVTGEKRSHWRAKAPAGMTVEWDAEIIADRPNELIAWRSLAGADVDNAGSVRFMPAPGGRGTEVRVEIQYISPGGVIGATIARLFGEAPDQQVRADLRRFKQVIEVGEVVRSEATAQGSGPARPSAAPAGA